MWANTDLRDKRDAHLLGDKNLPLISDIFKHGTHEMHGTNESKQKP